MDELAPQQDGVRQNCLSARFQTAVNLGVFNRNLVLTFSPVSELDYYIRKIKSPTMDCRVLIGSTRLYSLW